MSTPHIENPFEEGVRELSSRRTGEALKWFEMAVEKERTPLACAYLAYCRAKEKGTYSEAIALCMDAMKEEPKNSEIYLTLGRVYLLAGKKKSAIRAFDLGLRCGKNPQIVNELILLGRRKAPPLPFLDRGHPLNKYLGKFLKTLGLR
jgi:tetratricopeptide (TPR) repeat protein